MPPDTETELIEVLERSGVRWVVIGGRAVARYAPARTVHDLDLVVDGQRLPSLLAALKVHFPRVIALDHGPEVRLDPLDVDLVPSTQHPLFDAAMRLAVTMDGLHVPLPEVLVALAFMAGRSAWRGPAQRRQDLADLGAVYRATPRFDRERAVELVRLVYAGAGADLVAMLDRIDRGQPA